MQRRDRQCVEDCCGGKSVAPHLNAGLTRLHLTCFFKSVCYLCSSILRVSTHGSALVVYAVHFFFLFVWSRNVQIYDKWWIDVEQFRKGEFPEYGARSECIGNLCRLSTVSEDNLTFHILLQKENQFDNDKMQGCLLTYMFLLDRSLHSW